MEIGPIKTYTSDSSDEESGNSILGKYIACVLQVQSVKILSVFC